MSRDTRYRRGRSYDSSPVGRGTREGRHSGTESDVMNTAEIAQARARIASMGIDVASMLDEDIEKMVVDRERRFREEAPMTAAGSRDSYSRRGQGRPVAHSRWRRRAVDRRYGSPVTGTCLRCRLFRELRNQSRLADPLTKWWPIAVRDSISDDPVSLETMCAITRSKLESSATSTRIAPICLLRSSTDDRPSVRCGLCARTVILASPRSRPAASASAAAANRI